MSLICPYCQKEFEANEILFYTGTASSNFFRTISGERSVTQTGSVMTEGNVTDFSSRVRVAPGRRGIQRTGDFRRQDTAAAEQQEDQKEDENKFPLGKSVEDLVASEFLKKFGAGSLFRFQRTASFYGIKDEYDVPVDEDNGYGFVTQWEDEGRNIPLVLNIPSINKKLTERVCPRCHCDIPKDYFMTDPSRRHVAALAGCTSAGKTQFITVALRDLVGASFHSLKLGSVEWTTCSRWFHDLYVEQYERKDGTMEGTRKEYSLFPLMLRVITNKDGAEETHFISFIDCAGEYANNMEFAANQNGFQEASELLLMIDCGQLFPDDVELREGELKCSVNYESATKPLKEFNLCPNLQHVVIVMTKCDAIISKPGFIRGRSNQFVDDSMCSFSHDMTCHRGSVDMTTIRRIDEELNMMLNEHGEGDLSGKIARDLKLSREDVSLLAVSTYYWQGGELICKPDAVSGHHRIVEPLLLAMVQWGILPWEEKEYVPDPFDAQQNAIAQQEAPPKRRGLFGRR